MHCDCLASLCAWVGFMCLFVLQVWGFVGGGGRVFCLFFIFY